MGIARSKFKVTSDIRRILLESEEMEALVSDKVFPVVAPKGTEGDFIFIQRDEYSKDRSKMGVASQQCKVFVVAVSDDYDRSAELADKINDVLEGDYKDPELSIRLEDSTEEFEDGKYVQILSFSII